MKKYFLWLFTFLSFMTSVQAYDGIVIVLEAPLLKEADMGSTVLQTIRKGQRVYIPRHVADASDLPEFIPTFDRAGNPAFVPSKYIKVITGTPAEKNQPITIAGHDPTDYRLEEPIPSTYPFDDRSFLRTSVALFLGSNNKSPYGYNGSFNEQKYKNEMGLRFMFTKKVDHDKYDRFYFGAIGFFARAENTLYFKNETLASEMRQSLRAGPWITYDIYKSEKYRLAIGTGFTFNYHRATLEVDNNLHGEERTFTGYSLSPMTSTTFQVNDIFPNIDFISGVDLSLYLPHTLENKSEPEFPELWGEDNQIKSSLKAQASAFLGLQIKY